MKHSRPRPTVLILAGKAKERAARERALSDDFDCFKAVLPDEAGLLMFSQFMHAAICIGDLDGKDCVEVFDYLPTRWPETMLFVPGNSGKSKLAREVHGSLSDAAAQPALSGGQMPANGSSPAQKEEA